MIPIGKKTSMYFHEMINDINRKEIKFVFMLIITW